MEPLDAVALARSSDTDLVALLARPDRAEPAMALMRERLGDAPERCADDALAAAAAAHDLSRTWPGGATGPLPSASLRALARREIARRGRDATAALRPAHGGVRCVAALEGHDDEVRRLEPCAGGYFASTACGFDRLVWHVAGRRRVARAGGDDGLGAGVLLRRRSGAVSVVRLGAPGPRPLVAAPPGAIPAVAGGRFALEQHRRDGATVAVCDIGSGATLFARGGYPVDVHVGERPAVALSAGGRFLTVGSGYASHLDVFDLDGGGARELASGGPGACLVALAPEPWAVLSIDDRHVVIDLDAGTAVLRVPGGGGPAALDTGRGRLVRGVGGEVEVRDLSGAIAWSADVAGQVDEVAVERASGRVAALVRSPWNLKERSYRPTARVWDAGGAPLAAIEGSYAAALLPGGTQLVTGGRWGTIWLWELESR